MFRRIFTSEVLFDAKTKTLALEVLKMGIGNVFFRAKVDGFAKYLLYTEKYQLLTWTRVDWFFGPEKTKNFISMSHSDNIC